ncbi:MAG: hypothetical protein ACOCYV_00625 [Planctomycetota bacterium]
MRIFFLVLCLLACGVVTAAESAAPPKTPTVTAPDAPAAESVPVPKRDPFAPRTEAAPPEADAAAKAPAPEPVTEPERAPEPSPIERALRPDLPTIGVVALVRDAAGTGSAYLEIEDARGTWWLVIDAGETLELAWNERGSEDAATVHRRTTMTCENVSAHGVRLRLDADRVIDLRLASVPASRK